ncbi:hypothetical protein L3X38_027719 [Prunus dulcis]|uniref:Uncharacterized protein n=1 Tax=Prunus dulcis TaxID=3755 RepID=A0AAD4VR27_PRUDU|nr:hypothetical protein L3X38_027719 [Prunus dulcis]
MGGVALRACPPQKAKAKAKAATIHVNSGKICLWACPGWWDPKLTWASSPALEVQTPLGGPLAMAKWAAVEVA